MEVSYCLSRKKILGGPIAELRLQRRRNQLFATMARNAGSIADYLNLPPDRVVELGARVQL